MRKLLFVLTLLGAAAFIAAPQSLKAQDEESVTEEVETEEVVEEVEPVEDSVTLIELFNAGGWAMYPLAALSISGFGLIIYNFLVLRPKTFLAPETVSTVEEALKKGDIEAARTACDENPTPVTNILSAGLSRIEADQVDPAAMEKAMEETSTEEMAQPFIWINYLQIIATLSPMVGLLGTVSGMVKAFRTIASQGMGQPQVLAENISEALITTATGLTVAIPAMLFYFIFKNKYGKIASSVSRTIGNLHHEFVSSLRRG